MANYDHSYCQDVPYVELATTKFRLQDHPYCVTLMDANAKSTLNNDKDLFVSCNTNAT